MNREILAVFSILALAVPAFAHHNYRLNFDDKVEITLEGIVSEVSWANPHITIYLDVTNDNGEVIKWALPTAAPGVARRNGLTSEVLQAGDKIVISGWPARDKSLQMRARVVTLENGKEIPLHPTDRNRNRDRDRDPDR
jgi:hypothetical protein